MIWEDIDDTHKRTPIFGGWLVKTYEDVFLSLYEDIRPQTGYQWQVSMTFVPDSSHEWRIQNNDLPENHCQNGRADICLAGAVDGVCCAENECDIDEKIRFMP